MNQSDPRPEELSAHIADILRLIGEDPQREGLVKTPQRVAKAMMDLTRGYSQDPIAILQSARIPEDHHQMVTVKDIPFY